MNWSLRHAVVGLVEALQFSRWITIAILATSAFSAIGCSKEARRPTTHNAPQQQATYSQPSNMAVTQPPATGRTVDVQSSLRAGYRDEGTQATATGDEGHPTRAASSATTNTNHQVLTEDVSKARVLALEAMQTAAAAEAQRWAEGVFASAQKLIKEAEASDASNLRGEAVAKYREAQYVFGLAREEAIRISSESSGLKMAIEQVNQAKAEADRCQAQRWARERYEQARDAERTAKAESNAPVTATERLREAKGLYDLATREVRALETTVQAYERARVRYVKAVGGVNPVLALEYAPQRGKELASLLQVAESSPSPLEAAEAYERAAACVPEIREACLLRLMAQAKACQIPAEAAKALGYLEQVLCIDPTHAEASKLRSDWVIHCPKPGDTRTNSIGITIVYIPAGAYLMGSPPEEKGRDRDEGPQHQVRIEKGFWMGICEVTQGQYKTVTGRNPSHGKAKDDGLPVRSSTWEEAVEFCRLLTRLDGRSYRLPTEQEWEYACRAGTTTRYCFGNDDAVLPEYARFRVNSDYFGPQPVGQKRSNDFKLYDMHGNVWEWCQDVYDGHRYLEELSGTPRNVGPAGSHVVRGGSWYNAAADCRSASRDHRSGRQTDVGFRVVMVPTN